MKTSLEMRRMHTSCCSFCSR